MRVADYIMKTLADCGLDTAFLVTGGMAMHLNDALAGESRITTVCCHHEQAAAYAAEGTFERDLQFKRQCEAFDTDV